MCKISETAIGKNQQIAGLKVLIYPLHYITMYFVEMKFPNKESVATQEFAFSRF